MKLKIVAVFDMLKESKRVHVPEIGWRCPTFLWIWISHFWSQGRRGLNKVSDGQGFSKGASFVFWVCRFSFLCQTHHCCVMSCIHVFTCDHTSYLSNCLPSVFVFPESFRDLCTVALWKVSHFAPVQIRIAALSKAAGRSGRKNQVKTFANDTLFGQR